MSDPREPLWATSLANQPRPEADVVVHALEVDDGEAIADAAPAPPARPRLPPAGAIVLAIAAAAAAATLLVDRATAVIDEVPSNWGEVPMSCETARIEQDGRAVEAFSCRALGGGRLPPGVYRSPEYEWFSDLTARPARASRIEISSDGALTGWAVY